MFTVAVALLFVTAVAGPQQPVTFGSPCDCQGNHGEHRWSVRVDPSLPPTDASPIQSVTLLGIFSWPGPDVHLKWESPRVRIENNWYALTGREADKSPPPQIRVVHNKVAYGIRRKP
jgi:hypothetical protein